MGVYIETIVFIIYAALTLSLYEFIFPKQRLRLRVLYMPSYTTGVCEAGSKIGALSPKFA